MYNTLYFIVLDCEIQSETRFKKCSPGGLFVYEEDLD